MREFAWTCSAIVAASALAVGIAVVVDVGPLARQIIVVWFLLVAPGFAFGPLLRLGSPAAFLATALAISFSIEVAVALLMLLLGQLNATLGLLILMAVCVVGILLQLGEDRAQHAEPRRSH